MRTGSKIQSLLFASAVAWSGMAACGGEEEKAQEAAEPEAPALGVLELPVSLRTADPAPSGFHAVEVTPAALRLGDKQLLTLDAGRLKPADLQGDVIPALKAALTSSARAGLALGVHSSLPYGTAARVLHTAAEAGVSKLSLKVRKATGTTAGWMTLGGFAVGKASKNEEEVAFPSVAPRKWDEFVRSWEAIYNACREAETGGCAHVPQSIAEGGNLKLVLLAKGSGVNLNFFRVGLGAEELAAEEKQRESEIAAKKEDFKQGRLEQTDLEEALLKGPPASEALFQFRSKEAVKDPSPVSATMKPLCGSNACGVVLQAEDRTLMVRVAQLLGAAFPDGSAAPTVVFELPAQ